MFLKARGYTLEDWQKDLLSLATELTKEGYLRFSQFFVSMGRQNGKSELAVAYQLIFLLHFHAPLLISVASNAEQARITYDRLSTLISSNPALAQIFSALTDTRGLRKKDGGKVEIKASKGAALQGLAIRAGMVDELHITAPAVWNALLSGLGGRPDCQLFGITTAGDETSELLSHLYTLAEDPHAPPSFGFAIWEADTPEIPEEDSELSRLLHQANPAIASGRVDVQRIIEIVRTLPPEEAVRYHLNRFSSSTAIFVPLSKWGALKGEITPLSRPVYGVDKSVNGNWATITAAQRIKGMTYTEVVASLHNPSLQRLRELCLSLPKPAAFVVNGYSLKELAGDLKKRGHTVETVRSSEECVVSATFYHLIVSSQLKHSGHSLLTLQLQGAIRKSVGEHYKISKKDSEADIDAVFSTAFAVHYAEVYEEKISQLF